MRREARATPTGRSRLSKSSPRGWDLGFGVLPREWAVLSPKVLKGGIEKCYQ